MIGTVTACTECACAKMCTYMQHMYTYRYTHTTGTVDMYTQHIMHHTHGNE